MYVGLKKRKHYRQESELDNVRVRGDVHRLITLQLSVCFQRSIDHTYIVCRDRLRHVREDGRIERFVTVEIDSRVVRTMKEASEDQHHAAAKQQAARRAAIREQSILHLSCRWGPKMLHETQEKSESGKDYQQSAEVRKNAGPANRLQRAMFEANVVNEKNACREQHPSGKK